MNESTPLRQENAPPATLAGLVRWLAYAGLRNMALEQMVDEFCRRLNQLDIAVARTFVGMNTLHPMVRARSMIWDRVTGASAGYEFNHADISNPVWQQSPFIRMLREQIDEQRMRLDQPGGSPDTPVFEELRAAGMTEWFGCVFPFGELTLQMKDTNRAEHADQLGLVCSFTTDKPGGYAAADMALLKEVLPIFALAVKGTAMRTVGRGLLATYLGNDPADRVLAGTIFRGEVQSVEAVLYYADLRGFTPLADTMPGKQLITMLDDYFDCMARPVVQRGGEILKFMGDGLLAAFGVESAARADVCRTALDAANEALVTLETLNAERRAAGLPTAGLDVALHVGTVLYGNVGTDARLDFTVIGPAVNEVSRIELLCKLLDQNILVSRAFADAATHCRGRLVSLGHHQLIGVRGETELFTMLRGI